mgnify:CR=1 FL=1
MTVGIINVPFVEQQLMNYAKQQNNAMLGVVTYATAYTLATSAALAQALDQPRQLSLVAPAVLRQLALRGARVMAEVVHHLAFHVRDVVRPVAQHLVLLRAVLVHHVMHEIQHVVRQPVGGPLRLPGGMVDIVI